MPGSEPSDDLRGDGVYQPGDDGPQEDTGVLDDDDTLLAIPGDPDAVTDPLDEGFSPPERPRAVEREGVTAEEAREGSSLDQRLAEEVPEQTPPPGDGIGDTSDTEGEPIDGAETGEHRAGRLSALEESVDGAARDDLYGVDEGIDGGAASAEEAAVHIVEPPEERT